MTSPSQETATYAPSAEFAANAHVDAAKYEKLYAESIADPEAFWAEQGKILDWIKPYTKVKNTDFTLGQVDIKWYEDGTLNVCTNCVDRHLATRGDQTAIIFEPDDPNEPARHITYKTLHHEVGKMAAVLEKLGVTEIEALGQPFDPARHNAGMHVEDESAGENTVVEVFQQGYALGDKILRFAMVKVAN